MSDYLQYQGFHVLKLRGTDAEMGFQHGQILRDAIQRGPIPFFKKYLPRSLQPLVGQKGAQTLQYLLHQVTGKKLFASFPKPIQEHMQALAEGAELPLQDLIEAFVLPDLFLWLVSRSNRLQMPLPAPQLGCSSAFAQGSATVEGQMFHARNLDYMGVGHWDREQAILFYQPEGSQAYVSISAAGIPLGGVTAMNEAGLTLAVHQHLSCLNVELGGTPIGVAGDQVMRQAETLADAVRILEAHPPNVCWTYLIASARENAILCYETTAQGSHYFISEEPHFAYTNFYLNPELAERETHLYPSQWRSNLDRYGSIQRHFEHHEGPLDANQMARILAEPGADRCRLSRPLAMLFTVSSAVFQPQQGLVYVGEGPVPTSQRRFHAFDLSQQAPRPDLSPLDGGLAEPAQDAAFTAYRQAYEIWFHRADSAKALMLLEQACLQQPRESLYAYMAGLLALDAQRPGQAIYWLNKALELGHPDPQRQAAFYLWRGRARDMAGLRQEAKEDYHQVFVGLADPGIEVAAQKGLKQRWHWRHLALEFNYADIMKP